MESIIDIRTIEKFEKEGKKIISLKAENGEPLVNITYGEKPNYKQGCDVIINLNF